MGVRSARLATCLGSRVPIRALGALHFGKCAFFLLVFALGKRPIGKFGAGYSVIAKGEKSKGVLGELCDILSFCFQEIVDEVDPDAGTSFF